MKRVDRRDSSFARIVAEVANEAPEPHGVELPDHHLLSDDGTWIDEHGERWRARPASVARLKKLIRDDDVKVLDFDRMSGSLRPLDASDRHQLRRKHWSPEDLRCDPEGVVGQELKNASHESMVVVEHY